MAKKIRSADECEFCPGMPVTSRKWGVCANCASWIYRHAGLSMRHRDHMDNYVADFTRRADRFEGMGTNVGSHTKARRSAAKAKSRRKRKAA